MYIIICFKTLTITTESENMVVTLSKTVEKRNISVGKNNMCLYFPVLVSAFTRGRCAAYEEVSSLSVGTAEPATSSLHKQCR